MDGTIKTEIHRMCKQILKNQVTILESMEAVSEHHDAMDKRVGETNKLLKRVGNRGPK